MTKGKVAVIGLGPTGSFAARAAFDMGYEVDVYVAGDPAPKIPYGAMWLHWVPEDVTNMFEPTQIYIKGIGTARNYIERQWGKKLSATLTSSFPETPVWETGYNPTEVLEHLVPDTCEMILIPYPFSDGDIRDLAMAYAAVFQTFASKDSRDFQPALLPYVAAARFGTEDVTSNWVVYNGGKTGSVVREACLWGHRYLEFPKGMSVTEVKEQMDLTGYQIAELKDLNPHTKSWQGSIHPKVHYVGRWATWSRKYLSHDAYNHVQKILKEVE